MLSASLDFNNHYDDRKIRLTSVLPKIHVFHQKKTYFSTTKYPLNTKKPTY
jgi:hypothetical protein